MLFMVYRTPGASRESRNTHTSTGGLIVKKVLRRRDAGRKYSLKTLGREAAHVRIPSPTPEARR